jgi:hypothetical protein
VIIDLKVLPDDYEMEGEELIRAKVVIDRKWFSSYEELREGVEFELISIAEQLLEKLQETDYLEEKK